MAQKDKQTYNIELYIKKIKAAKEVYAERKKFLEGFSLKKKKDKPKDGGGEVAASGGGGSVNFNGELPTVAQYTGPDVYTDKLLNGGVYQNGLKGKIAGTDQWNQHIKEQAAKAGVNPLLVKVIMATESGGVHDSTPNSSNCVGLMQTEKDITENLKLDFGRACSDPVYNIYVGCMILKEKHNYAGGVISRGKNPYAEYKSKGFELKQNGHGVSWLYNGFSVPFDGKNKVYRGGYVYANQIVAMYKGFGRDAYTDTMLTLDVLSGGGGSGGTAAGQAGGKGTGGKWEYNKIFANGDEVVKFLNTVDTSMINGVFVHHTYDPDHTKAKGQTLTKLNDDMKKFHTVYQGWDNIAQHFTIGVDGQVILGRDIASVPCSAKGYNGTTSSHPAMYEMIGNFDIGKDKLEGKQLESAVAIAKYFALKAKGVQFHREGLVNGKEPKSCPGSGINKDWFMGLVKGSAKASAFSAQSTTLSDKDIEENYAAGCDLSQDPIREDFMDTPVKLPPTEDELAHARSFAVKISIPTAQLKESRIIAPKYPRSNYVEDFKLSSSYDMKKNYSPLPPHEFIHLNGPQENFYTSEARQAFRLLKDRLGYKILRIARGFDPSDGESSHSIGISMDIYADSTEEAIYIADTAWLTGFRAIAVGPKFVHVDIGPESAWGYDNLPLYQGPGTLRAGEFSYGYKQRNL
ncbi:TPA: transglycosylase SLT domain-containing protein [Bacillus cereus]|nr:transglycosylase SLT domain-containing protein [Bacillus cereus]EKS8351670.1 transglycosylase SLT domain-containing protein [Bacillus cereus]EKS8355590.1 transglycosylase SLT domain-containing protein [Bacillus cereus]MCU4730086.1 transglycosylase SLT domain-containing protein [Bacillus cereus]HDR4540701.1 transglycosylase SLT domain-containing protein [Bacillus cereus]